MANKTSRSNEAYFARYKQSGLYAANRKARLAAQLIKQPNNKQLELAIKNISSYRRKTPTTPYWSHTMIATAKMLKSFTGAFSKNVFSAKPDEADAAKRLRNPNIFSKSVTTKSKYSDYSIAVRAHDKTGALIWN
jgi:hypothetical protein